MATLTCDICGGMLSMDPSGDFAVCESCGMKHTKDRVKAKAQEITGTVKIDNTDAIKEQLSNWEKMAGDAFDNSNYSEAYTYYCKILEKNVGYWFATYRKGMCMGWQANLKNMHANEVLGGVVDATKLLYSDETQTDSLKANGSLIMSTEVYNWVNALNNLSVGHCNEYGDQLVSAAQEFYQEEQLICSIIKFNIGMITEFVYENYENKEGLESLVDAICNLGRTTVSNMNASFRIKTGSKWNSFWQIYEDVYEDVSPDYTTRNARSDLNSAISDFQRNIRTWKENYARKIKEQERKEKEERKAKYWAEHAEEKQQYDARIIAIDSELKTIREQTSKYDARIADIQKDLSQMIPAESQLDEIKRQESDLMSQKSKLGLFAGKQKKQLQAQIDALQPQIHDIESTVMRQKKDIQDDVSARVSVVEAECKPFMDKIDALEKEKSMINNELTKER